MNTLDTVNYQFRQLQHFQKSGVEPIPVDQPHQEESPPPPPDKKKHHNIMNWNSDENCPTIKEALKMQRSKKYLAVADKSHLCPCYPPKILGPRTTLNIVAKLIGDFPTTRDNCVIEKSNLISLEERQGMERILQIMIV